MAVMSVPATVLLVEDNAVIAMNTEILLLDLGVQKVETAASVAGAMALIDAERFDLALLDLRLKEDEDSLPIAQRLRAEGVPFVFATGANEDLTLPEDLQGAPMLKKPYGFDDLAQIVRGD